jgi:hypothetical protein
MHDLISSNDARLTPSAIGAIDGWIDTIDATRGAPRQSLRAWMRAHTGARVDTLQAHVSVPYELPASYGIRGLWAPESRTLHAGATFADLDGSRRDYAGVLAVSATPDAWIGWDNDADTLIAYRIAE